MHDPVQVLNRRSYGDPGEILPKRSLHEKFVRTSLHDLVQVLVRRSCGDPVEIPLKRSLH